MTHRSSTDLPSTSQTTGTPSLLWMLRKGLHRVTAEACRHEDSWQLRLFTDGVLVLWYACWTREATLWRAEQILDGFVDDGWVPEGRIGLYRAVRVRPDQAHDIGVKSPIRSQPSPTTVSKNDRLPARVRPPSFEMILK